MSTRKNSVPSKLISEDFNDSQFLNDSPKDKKQTKRQRSDKGENDFVFLSETESNVAKKNKIGSVETYEQQKTLNVMSKQLGSRQQINKKFLKNLSDIIMNFEAEYNILKENEEKLEHLTGKFMESIHQSTTVYEKKLNSFKEIYAIYKKKYEENGAEQKAVMDKLGIELEDDIYKLKQKIISETKRNERDNLQKYFLQAMKNNSY